MDTLGCVGGILALLLHVATHPRILRFYSSVAERPQWATTLELALAAFAIFAGVIGYHRDWPRWANGRSIVAVSTGAIILAVALLEFARHS